ncbi:MAG TPA: SDR family NAD(P)-dependent oxidoreductase [Candidatus Dormibacteraeota bacterium]|nr:SDR family NAD(P)-dependent oxidoreductase [Candidatus Dormibacteraeota bacterium]
MEISLEGKVALVTGAGPNIGSGIALALARYGARVACNDIRPEVADACVRRIERNGGTAMAAPGDVTSEAEVTSYLGKVLDAWGRIDILVNNAALLGGRGVLEETLADFNRAVNVAAAGTFLNTKHAAIAMIERGIRGSIVCILSSNAWQGAPGVIAYAFHKGGLANFVRAAAMDLAPYGIRVNSFTPTAPEPDNPELIAERRAGGGRRATPPPAGERPPWWRPTGSFDVRRNIPMGAPSTPTDIGHCVAWMCSDYARLITGCDFVVDGGARAKYWAYTPPEDNAGPVPLVKLDLTGPE